MDNIILLKCSRYLTTLLEDVTVALVVVARGAGLAVHVRHVQGRDVQLEGGHAGVPLARLLATQLTRLQ
jgi:hypothetical protein